jgi:hypothetical protein
MNTCRRTPRFTVFWPKLSPRNPFRCNTYRLRPCNPFIRNTYKNRGEGDTRPTSLLPIHSLALFCIRAKRILCALYGLRTLCVFTRDGTGFQGLYLQTLSEKMNAIPNLERVACSGLTSSDINASQTLEAS